MSILYVFFIGVIIAAYYYRETVPMIKRFFKWLTETESERMKREIRKVMSRPTYRPCGHYEK